MIINKYVLLLGVGLLLAGCSDQPEQSAPSAATPPLTAEPAATAPAVTDLRAGSSTESDRSTAADPTPSSGSRELEWDALIPDDYQPDKLLAEYNLDEMSDDDPRAAELMAKLKELWDKAPVREDLDGAEIRLPGFVVPVEGDERETTAFLLVPYYGACVHVPPPPANQTVYVVTEPGKGTRPELFDVVWVTGTMSVKRIANDIAEAGYTLYASQIEPYE